MNVLQGNVLGSTNKGWSLKKEPSPLDSCDFQIKKEDFFFEGGGGEEDSVVI